MALNYSHRPVVISHTSEKNLVSPLRIVSGGYVESVPEDKGWRSWRAISGDDDWNFDRGKDKVDQGYTPDLPSAASKEIYDLLPSDPFDMDQVTAITALTGLLEDFEAGGRSRQDQYGLFAGWNFVWNNSLNKLSLDSPSSSNFQSFEKPNTVAQCFSSDLKGKQCREEVNTGSTSDFCDFGNVSTSCDPGQQIVEVDQESNFEGTPHEALAFALGYLGVKDLLAVEMVCKSLCSTVRGDPLYWRNIHIDEPLNEKITDDVLVHLTSKAQGFLHSLNLVECIKVTDDGLRRVLESNPQLKKLCVPGCTRITIEGMINNMRMYHRNKDGQGIKCLRIGGLYGVTVEDYEELISLLGADSSKLGSQYKPHFYHGGNLYLPSDDDRVMDIEKCPLCDKFRLIYDCPAESCQGKVCRACSICIQRCVECGRCVSDTEFLETFSLENLCVDCYKQPPTLAGPSEDMCEPTDGLNKYG